MKNEQERFEENFDKILKWYRSDGRVPLPPHLEARLTIWKAIRDFILTYKPLTDSEIVRHFAQDQVRSEPQLYRDVRDTKRFFASMETVNKEFERIMLIAQIRNLRAMALTSGKLSIAAKCDTNLIAMGAFTEDDIDPDKQGKTIILNLSSDPKLVGAKENPNLLKAVELFIGEKARRELMIADDDLDLTTDGTGTH